MEGIKNIQKDKTLSFPISPSYQPGQSEHECENITPPCQFESAPQRLMCPSTSLHHPPLHLPPLKQLCCFGPALKAVLITGTERRSEWQAGSILLKPNERNLCRVCGLQRPEEAVPLPIVLLLLSSLFCRFFIPTE